MRGTNIFKAAALALAAIALTAATDTAQSGWLATVAETDGGHRIGNPQAKVRLIEYVSYTCPHCARYTRESEAALRAGYVAPGDVSVEIRHLIRDPVDLTAAMLANCGPTSRFAANHAAFMFGQDEWLAVASKLTAAQQQRWRTGEAAARRRAIAGDFGFYRIMEQRGYSRSEADRCLADETLARKLAETSARDWDLPGIGGTPSFSINGVVLPGTHSWPALEQQIKQFL